MTFVDIRRREWEEFISNTAADHQGVVEALLVSIFITVNTRLHLFFSS